MVNKTSGQPGIDLAWYADRYFELLATGDHQALPVAPNVAFTENGQALRLGQGLWATATGAAPTRGMTITDPDGSDGSSGQVATWGMASEAGQDVILGLRLKVNSGLITELETLVARGSDDIRLLNADRLRVPTPGFLDLVDEADRPTRDELRQAANLYMDGVSGDKADIIPVTDDCTRVENGVQTVLNPTGYGLAPGLEPNAAMALGVAQQVREGYCRHIEAARERRVLLTDPTRGLVFATFFFDHAGKVRGLEGRAPFLAPNSMVIWEVFKVSGGLIRHIEAIINVFPYGMRSGWEEQ